MPYTLSMALLWVALAVLLGIVIGWLMRSVVAKRQIERARSNNVDTVELERLRGRVANLEPALAERDRLRSELDECRAGQAAVAQGFATLGDAPASPPAEGHDAVVATPLDTESVTAESVREPVDEPVADAIAADPIVRIPVDPEPQGPAGSDLDLDAAAVALGGKVALDDLTVVDGIGPKIAELCRGIGIVTWADLAQTEVSLLRTMLHDAGPRFRTHDPGTWPEQASLLAAGRWDDFRAFAERLEGGKLVD